MICHENQEYLRTWAGFSNNEYCIGNVINDELKAVVLYGGFSGKSCQIHIVANGSHWMNREFLLEAFDYPFNKLGLKVIIATIAESNLKSLKLSRHLGFQEIATIPDAHDDGNLVILEMRPDNWVKLGAYYGCR